MGSVHTAVHHGHDDIGALAQLMRPVDVKKPQMPLRVARRVRYGGRRHSDDRYEGEESQAHPTGGSGHRSIPMTPGPGSCLGSGPGSITGGTPLRTSHSTYGSAPGRRLRWSDRIPATPDRKSTRLNSSHVRISYAVFC